MNNQVILPSFAPSPELSRAIRLSAQRELIRRNFRKHIVQTAATVTALAATITLIILPQRTPTHCTADTLMQLLAYDQGLTDITTVEEGYYAITHFEYPADYYSLN